MTGTRQTEKCVTDKDKTDYPADLIVFAAALSPSMVVFPNDPRSVQNRDSQFEIAAGFLTTSAYSQQACCCSTSCTYSSVLSRPFRPSSESSSSATGLQHRTELSGANHCRLISRSNIYRSDFRIYRAPVRSTSRLAPLPLLILGIVMCLAPSVMVLLLAPIRTGASVPMAVGDSIMGRWTLAIGSPAWIANSLWSWVRRRHSGAPLSWRRPCRT